MKAPCRVATTTNITLSGEQTIDGVAVVADDRVLVKNQTNSIDNGIYLVSTGAWARDYDADNNLDLVSGTTVFVNAGSINGNSYFVLTSVNPIQPGTTGQTWVVVTAAALVNLAASSGSSLVGFLQAGTGAVARTTQAKMREIVSVTDFGAIGDGATDNAAAFALARTYAASSVCTLVFPPGTYNYSVIQNFNFQGARLLGLGKVNLHFTGTGNCWSVDAGPNPGDGTVVDVEMDNFTISGTASATNGLLSRGADHCTFRNINVTNVTAAGLNVVRNTASLFENFRCSLTEAAFSTTPANGILIEQRVSQQTSACTFIQPIIEGVSGSGLKLAASGCLRCNFQGGTIEGNGGLGIEILASSAGNVFNCIDLEGNTLGDISVTSNYNTFIGILGISNVANTIHLLSPALGNTFHGGQVGNVTLDSGTYSNGFFGTTYLFGAGTYTDNGSGNIRVGTYNQNTSSNEALRAGTTLISDVGAVVMTRKALTYAAPTAVNAATGNWFDLTVSDGSAFTISSPTNSVDGQRISITVRNSSGGAGGVITWGASYKMSAWTNPANGFSRTIDFKYNGTNWVQVSQTGVDVPN
jgi:hypothetical protein